MRLRWGSLVHNVVRKSENTFDVDGVRVQATVKAATSFRFEAQTGTRRTAAFVVRDGDRVFAQIGGRPHTLTVVNCASAASVDGTPQGGLEAPMPGRVTRVTVAVGDAVRRGQELIVVEAMKMENALVAPADGMVKSLAVKVGDMVAPGLALVVIEAAP